MSSMLFWRFLSALAALSVFVRAVVIVCLLVDTFQTVVFEVASLGTLQLRAIPFGVGIVLAQ